MAGLFGDGDRPSLVRSADGMLLLSLSFGGVLLDGLAQALGFGPCLFMGSVWPLTCRSGNERAEAGVDGIFAGLRLSLSLSLEGVRLFGLASGDGCVVTCCPEPDAFAGDVLPGFEKLLVVELEREGDGVGAGHFSGVRWGEGALVGLEPNLEVGIWSPFRPLADEDLVSATVLGLSGC